MGLWALENRMIAKRFRELGLKRDWDSDEDQIARDYFNPILAYATNYDRFAGWFTSKSLVKTAIGMEEFILNRGKIRLIVGGKLTPEDKMILKNHAEKTDEMICKNFLKDISSLHEAIEKDHLAALAWMLREGYLEIKIAVVIDLEGNPLSAEDVITEDLAHHKFGIFKDSHNDEIAFLGSINETGKAISDREGTVDSFISFYSWIDEKDARDVEQRKKDFMKYWNGKPMRTLILDIPTAAREKLLEIAPNNISDIDLKKYSIINMKKTEERNLRNYQSVIVDEWWNKNKGRGIAEVATGCGKTMIGIGCISALQENNPRGLILISCPTDVICGQWYKDIDSKITLNGREIKIDSLIVSTHCSTSKKFIEYLSNAEHAVRKKRENWICAIVTNGSLHHVQKSIEKLYKEGIPTLYIADEVHSVGAEVAMQLIFDWGSHNFCNWRLGLSATPKRLYDEEGNVFIESFFGPTLTPYTLDQAIQDRWLANYVYTPIYVELSSSEMSRYRQLTKLIPRFKSDDEKKQINTYALLRAKILKKANGKIETLKRVMPSLISSHRLDYTLFFCDDTDQLGKVEKILYDLKYLNYARLTESERDTNENLIRQNLINNFSKGVIHTLISIGVLNEGVNIKSARRAIILSSSTNPREYIQRRGRVLRQNETRDKTAEIIDFIVYPNIDKLDSEASELEKNLLRKELKRLIYFVNAASNLDKIFSDKTLQKLLRFVGTDGLI